MSDHLTIEEAAKRGFEQAMKNADLANALGDGLSAKDFPWEKESEHCKNDWRRVARAILQSNE